jgi:hypothetical protein
MLNLAIHHNIHLTRDQRYSLHKGNEVSVVGLSVPVWFYNKMSTEPAKEVFCWYTLRNFGKDMAIAINTDGYEIMLPRRSAKELEMDNEEWRKLNLEDKDRLTEIYSKLAPEASSKCLLDVIDGGSEWLSYREHSTIEKDSEKLNIMHFVCISTMEKLTSSIVRINNPLRS